MAESGGRLFVHTCRLKYSGHQANLTFVYEEEKNSVIESTTDDYGNSYSSHSFNQLIGVSDGYVYRLDHGDYNPRAIKLSRSSASGSVMNAGFTHVIDLSKTGAPGDNYTGVELGGFEVTDKTCVTAGAIVNYKNFDQNPDDTRNIFVAVTDKELKSTTVKMLTSYKKSSKCMAANPHLVKLGNNRLLLIWSEQKDENTLPHVTRFATIDANGNLTSSVYSNAFPLSDCKPILCRDGKVRWYASVFYNAVGDNVEYSDYYAKASFACLYTLDPSDLAASDGIFSFFGDADKSGVTGNCMWMLNGSVLTITGSGEMDHYTAEEPAPWGNQITKVLIVSGVKKIGAYAFGDCEKLMDVAIPGSVESIGDQAFIGCASLKVIHIPDGVKSIGDYSFGGCTALESVTLPNSIERIGDNAFDYCIALESITIPNGVKSIGDFAFAGCKALTSITIPDGVKSIGDYAFDECQRLAGMVIPDSVTSIGTEAVPSWCCIYGKKGITAEQYAEKNNNIFVPIGQEVAGKSGTWSWSLDQDFVLRIKGKGKIDDVEDFDPPWGYSIRKVVIDSGITEIGEHAFDECTELTEVIISDSMTEIGMNAFCYCDELTSVTIGNGVTYIAPGTFSGCPNLKSITIPESVVDMGICGLGWYYDWNDDENPHRQIEGFTIYGYRNSEAKRYADDNGFKFVDISPQSAIIPGDVDGDGTVTITDATMIQIYVADLIDFSEAQKEAADTNADEAIDITDATMIQMYVAEQIEHLG